MDSKNARKLIYPAAERNKEPILQVLKSYISSTKSGTLIEISSGSGQHVSHIAPHFPNLTFHPTELDKSLFGSINAYVNENKSGNICQAKFLDVTEDPSKWLNGEFPKNSVDYFYNSNLMHISPWDCSLGLFNGASYFLKPGGLLFTYGPYAMNGVITPDSNVRFDASLRSQNSSWGLRDIYIDLTPVAAAGGLLLKQLHDLPANNKLLVWEKT